MSHELRTPLNAILGFAQIMTRSQTLPSEHQENVSIIARSGEHLLMLINNILDLSKIEAGKTSLNLQNFDLHQLLNDVHDLLHFKADDRQLQILLEYDPNDLPRYVCSDPVKLRQVLINLIGNSIKFTEYGGIAVRAARSPHAPNTLEFAVEDSGAGIAPDELDTLFEAFTQTEAGRQAQEGTGLGLPISRRFVQLMGGDITVQSQLNQGSIFRFTIQVTEASAQDVVNLKPQRRILALEPGQPQYRLLIVDDKPLNRQLLIKLLAPFGFALKEASNGQEAIELWKSWHPHLTWMDMRMPVLDGYQATQHIRQLSPPPEIETSNKIIAVTASMFEEERAVVLAAGCDDFVRKPFREDSIFEMLAKHLDVRFIYEEIDATESPPDRTALQTKDLDGIPRDILDRLVDAIVSSDLDQISQELDKISSHNQNLAKVLRKSLDQFEYEPILELISETTV
jgi:CheY-like chemotaxis protein